MNEENYVCFIVMNVNTNEYYYGVDGYNTRTHDYNRKFCKSLISAYKFDSRKEGNEFIREYLRTDGYIVKKLTIDYKMSL